MKSKIVIGLFLLASAVVCHAQLTLDPPFPFFPPIDLGGGSNPAGIWFATGIDNSGFDFIDDHTVSLHAAPPPPDRGLGIVGIFDATYLNSIISGVSFDWALVNNDPGSSVDGYLVEASYFRGSLYDDSLKSVLFSGPVLGLVSGSVLLEDLNLSKFSFRLSAVNGSSDFLITNLSFTVIPESSSCCLILSLIVSSVAIYRRKFRV